VGERQNLVSYHLTQLRNAGLVSHVIGAPNSDDELRITLGDKSLLCETRVDLQRAWSEMSYRMQSLRDNPECAQQEFDRILDKADAGLSVSLTFDPAVVVGQDGALRLDVICSAIAMDDVGRRGHHDMTLRFDRLQRALILSVLGEMAADHVAGQHDALSPHADDQYIRCCHKRNLLTYLSITGNIPADIIHRIYRMRKDDQDSLERLRRLFTKNNDHPAYP